jgi:hypothetical protein
MEAFIEVTLIVTGVLTALTAIGLLFPRALLDTLFGLETNDGATLLLGRHWSLLLLLIGGLLIYAAYHPEVRIPVMVAAATEKIGIALLVVVSPLRKRPMTLLAIGADLVMALLYVLFLVKGLG